MKEGKQKVLNCNKYKINLNAELAGLIFCRFQNSLVFEICGSKFIEIGQKRFLPFFVVI